MATTASIQIIVDDGVAAAALKGINAEGAKLTPTFQAVGAASGQALEKMDLDVKKVRESAALLGEEFGVKIPRALRGTIAEFHGIGQIFQTAFSGMAILGFIEIAKVAGEKIADVTANMMGWGEEVKKAMESQIKLNEAIMQSNEEAEKLAEAYRLIGLQGLQLLSEKQKIANEHFDAAKEKVSGLTAELAKLQRQAQETQQIDLYDPATGTVAGQIEAATKDAEAAKSKIGDVKTELALAQVQVRLLGQETKNTGREFDTTFGRERADAIRELGTATQEALTKLQTMIAGAAKAGATAEDQITIEEKARIDEIMKIWSLYGEDPRVREQVAAAGEAIEKEASDKRIKLLTDEADKTLKILTEEDIREAQEAQAQAEKLRRMEDETINAERSAAIASAPPWARANATILADYQARMDKIKEMVATGDLDNEHAARQAAAAWTDAFSKMRDQLASDMESLFDNITSGNIGKFFLTQFKHLVFQMVASWILGMTQMRNASAGAMGGGGGILGTIFGGLFGGGGGGGGGFGIPGIGPGGTAPFADSGGFGPDMGPGASSTVIGGLGLSAGVGAGALGATLPSGAGPAGAAASGISGLLGKLFANGAGGVSGTGLATLGIGLLASTFRGGGILNALGGAAGGALTGFAIGGPIGAIIGGIAGFLSGIFGHSTHKARMAIQKQLTESSQKIEDAYDSFQIDYASSHSQLEQLRQQGLDALKQAGVKDIWRARTGHVDYPIDKVEKEIDATQAERVARAAITFGPAQFRVGGFVGAGIGGAVPSWFAASAMHFAGGGAVPAILHEGEYVLRPEAVSQIGRGNLDRMNSGRGGGGDISISFTVNTIDSKSFDSFIRNGGLDVIRNNILRALKEGAW